VGEGSASPAAGPQRPAAPLGRRRCEVTENAVSGGYRIVTALDTEGPTPLAGQFYMLATERGFPARTLLGFRDEAHSGGFELFRCCEVGLASEDGHAGHRGYVTDLLAQMLEGDDAAASAAVYACGPPAMLEAVRAMCAARGVRAELAMESPMACGFGACFGCAVPVAGGGYMRLCVDGPVVPAERIESALVEGSGHR
jgi:dihydroorotate dehydrogenase electron transfer subunit